MHEYPPEVEAQIRKEAKRFKEPLPKRVENKPELAFGMALYLNAWFELDIERERPHRISRSMCFQYAYDYDLTVEQRDDLWFYISQVDMEFLGWWIKKQPKKPKGTKRRGPNDATVR